MFANGDLRAVFTSPGYRRLLWTRLASQFADGLFQAGLAASILFTPEGNTDPIQIAFGFAVLLLPYSLLGPYVGVFLDRWSRRNVLVDANLVRAAAVIPTGLLIWAGSRYLFPLLALVVIGINRFFLAGLSASMPHVVEDRRLVTANAAATTLGTVVFSCGLGTAVLVQVLVFTADPPTNAEYAVVALSAAIGYFAASTIARLSFHPHDLGPDESERVTGRVLGAIADVSRGMVRGLRHLARRRGAAYLMFVQAAHRCINGVMALSVLLLYLNYFGDGTDYDRSFRGLGAIVLAGAAGSLLAAVITPVMTRRIGGRAWVTLLLAALAPVLLGLGLPYREDLLVIAVFLLNITAQGMKIVVDTAIQHECADEYRGRVFSLNDTLYNVCLVLGMFVGVQVLPRDGRAPAMLMIAAGGYLALAVWYGWAAARWARYVGDDIAPARPRTATRTNAT